MKNRCAGLAVVLLSLVAFSVANADFDGVIDPRTTVTVIDSATLTPEGYPDMTFLTPGWGTHTPFDVFHFNGVPRWIETITLHGTVQGFATHRPITEPHPDTWYPISVGVVTSYVRFYSGAVAEESKSAVERQHCLAVSPSVVTGHMTIRLQPVGSGRQVVEIHDVAGNAIRSLDCTAGNDGIATATWNLEDEHGRLVPEGVYFCRYAAGDVIAVRKILVAR